MKFGIQALIVLSIIPGSLAEARKPAARTSDPLAARKIIKSRLIDPYSVKFDAIVERRGLDHVGKVTNLVCGTYNAKNRFGGYVGAKQFVYVASEAAVFTSNVERLGQDGSVKGLEAGPGTEPSGIDGLATSIAAITSLTNEVGFWLRQCQPAERG